MAAPLRLSSVPGRGSVFTLELPLGKPPQKTPAMLGAARPRIGLTLEHRRIVVVEDEPAVREGLAARVDSAARSEFAVVPEVIVSAGDDHEATRRLLAFYGSTPAYRPVLDIHGWGDLQPELHALTKQGRWAEMGALITDEVLHTIAACGTPRQIAEHIRLRAEAAGGSETVCLYQPGPIAVDVLAAVVDELS